ncbi:MAG: hypothetical protein V4474_00265 [Patescibacteria group bacterium]
MRISSAFFAFFLATTVQAQEAQRQRIPSEEMAVFRGYYATSVIGQSRAWVQRLRRIRSEPGDRPSTEQIMLYNLILEQFQFGLRWEDIGISREMLEALAYGGKIT